MMALATLIPVSMTLPFAAVILAAVLVHARMVLRSNQPASRKRIRLANAAVMAVTVPLLVVGFSVVDHDRSPGAWAIVWMAALAFLALNIGLAVLDMINTLRLLNRTRRRLRTALTKASAASLGRERAGD